MKNKIILMASCMLLSACGGGSNESNSDNSGSTTPRQSLSAPGGAATQAYDGQGRPFLQFIPTLDLADQGDISRGRESFRVPWLDAATSLANRGAIDGLGPLFIANACSRCHVENGRAPSLVAGGTTDVGILFRLGDESGNPDPNYGGQLQSASTVANNHEGTVTWAAESNGRITFTASMTGAALDQNTNLGPRLAPQLTGMGLLDLIPDATILGYADENDANGDGISGRPNLISVNGQNQLGRFGWKAINPTLAHQAAGAFNGDMGLTTSINPNENCTAAQTICTTERNGGSPEISDQVLNEVEAFMAALAVPDRRITDTGQFNRGLALFEQVGCDNCHKSGMTTGTSNLFSQLSGQVIYPYTDLLLHDMGEDLADGVKEVNAGGNEWRTPPLWGIGLVEQSANARFLHDGRATTLDGAIRWHGGEALQTRQNYEALTDTERTDLLSFLRSI